MFLFIRYVTITVFFTFDKPDMAGATAVALDSYFVDWIVLGDTDDNSIYRDTKSIAIIFRYFLSMLHVAKPSVRLHFVLVKTTSLIKFKLSVHC